MSYGQTPANPQNVPPSREEYDKDRYLKGTYAVANLPQAGIPTGSLAWTTDTGTLYGFNGISWAPGSSPVNDVRSYGPKVGQGGDDTAAINAVLAASAKNGSPAYLAGLSLNSTGGHVHDVSLYSVYGGGATINFANMGSSATAWTTTCTVGGVNNDAKHQRYTMKELYLVGSGVGTGWYLNAASEPAVANVAFYSICVENFATGQLWGNNCYIIQHFGCIFNLNGAAIYMPGGLTNTGEGIHYFGGAVTNGAGGINIQGSGADVRFFGTSIDALTTYVSYGNGCILELNGCHVEFNNAASLVAEPITGTAHLNIVGGCIIADGTGPFSYPAVFNNTGLVRISGGCFLNNLQNSANIFNSGAGQIIVQGPTDTYSLTALPALLGTLNSPNNLMADGGFEQATIIDNVCIFLDTATITNRLTGSNISLAISSAAHHSGSQCLAATKSGGANSAADFLVAFPATPGQLFGGTYYIAANATYAQTIATSGTWALGVTGTGGVLNVLNSSNVGVTNFSPSATWTGITVPRTRCPSWANTFYISIYMNNLPASVVYLDDVNISAM